MVKGGLTLIVRYSLAPFWFVCLLVLLLFVAHSLEVWTYMLPLALYIVVYVQLVILYYTCSKPLHCHYLCTTTTYVWSALPQIVIPKVFSLPLP